MKTSLILSITGSLLIASTSLPAEDTLPLQAVNRANEVIDAAVEAYGGSDAIENLKTFSQKRRFTTYATNQSRVPGPPWDQNEQWNFVAIDFENQVFAGKNKGSGGGFDFHNKQIIKGEEGWQVSYRAGTVTPIAQPDFHTAAGPLVRVTPALLVKQLLERRHTAHWLGETEFQGRPHDVITLVMEVGPALSLYFDKETHILNRSERVLPPFGQVDYHFLDYETVDGIPFNKAFKLFVNDQPNIDIYNELPALNQDIDKYVALPTDLEMLEAGPAAPTDVLVQKAAAGVYFAGAGATYAMFVDMGDHIVAVGGTAGIPDRITAVRKEVGDKPIRYGVITHHHNDHVLGVAAYETEGATIFGLEQHEAVLRAAAADGEALKLRFVDGKHVIEGDGHTLELYDIGPTPHAEHILVAYVPEAGVLFEADHFVSPANGVMPPAQPVMKALAKAIDKLDLDVKTILSSHSPRIASMADLATSLKLEPADKKKVAP
ncbi:MAG: MBL fold metallo-hydrolase [Lysobacterales bacterium]|jgi:glyoxylase-like metal-dependent hydrolase (beta-lactamase superfamily II)